MKKAAVAALSLNIILRLGVSFTPDTPLAALI